MPTGASFQRPPQSQPQPAPADAAPTKRDLASWWKQFKKTTRRDEEKEQAATAPGIFGIPLSTSIRYANVAISLSDASGQSFTYGYVPIVVAKCGVYLKEKATHVEGIFRLAGAERRIKELQVIFNSPDRYGKGLDWTGYTVHDAANILRRYLRELPEPIIPLQFYEQFRDPLRNHQAQAVGEMEMQQETAGDFDPEATIRTYQQLITELPPLNRQLLLYILDLLAVFASKSDVNLMTAPNLSAIFQPGLLSHPSHDMAPAEYRLSQDVLIFLIENQDNFLVGMKGTAADEKTIQDVQSGPHSPARSPGTPPTPKGRSQHLLGRSASSASAGSESVRRYGSMRRNVSVNSKNSRQSNNAPSPVEVPPASPLTPPGKSGAVHRSNTVPSKKSTSPALVQTERFQPPRSPESPSVAAAVQAPVATSPPTSNQETPTMADTNDRALDPPSAIVEPSPRRSPRLLPFMGRKARSPTPNAERDGSRSGILPGDASPAAGAESPLGTPSRERGGFSSFFRSSPSAERERTEGKRPNKLQKRRPQEEPPASGSISQASLSGGSHPPSPGFAPFPGPGPAPNSNVDGQAGDLTGRSPTEGAQRTDSSASAVEGTSTTVVPSADTSTTVEPEPSATMLKPDEPTALKDLPQRTSGTATLRPGQSPGGSVRSPSPANEAAAVAEEGQGEASVESTEKHHRWRLSTSSKKADAPKSRNGSGYGSANLSTTGLGVPLGAGGSTSSVGSLGAARKSFTDDSGSGAAQIYSSDAEERAAGEKSTEKRGLSGWFKGKLQERKDREAEKERAKSPPPLSNQLDQPAFTHTLSPAANTDQSPESQEQQPPLTESQPPVDPQAEATSSQSPEAAEQVTGQPLAEST